MRRWTKISCLTIAGCAVVATSLSACKDEPHRRTSSDQAIGGGGACEAKPGELPKPDCDINTESKCEGTGACSIDEAKCGSKSTCLPIGDNKGKDVLDFRIRRLNIATPAALASDFIQNSVVTLNIDLAERICGEQGKGLFTWILRVDKKNNTIITGGAPPSTDSLNKGFCFARFDLGANKVQPISGKIQFDSAGNTFKSLEPAKVNIPIFLDADGNNVILLPITDVRVENVTISDEGNCIGHFRESALDNSCFEDKSACPRWTTSGSLGGYITLEEADGVLIRDLNNKSLCSFLAAETELKCARENGKIKYQGDYCSVTKAPGGCADSMWLAATFAASAAKIFDGNGTVPKCSGAVSDAGVDSGSDSGPSDAGDGGG